MVNNNIIFTSIIFILLIAISYVLAQIFGPKFAFLSVGLIIGTNMFGNVFTVIIPNQMNIINSSAKSKKFDTSLSLAAKQRSVHNNIITLLVLFIMLSGHASFVWMNKYNWLILSLLAIIFSTIQYYVNYKNKKEGN